MSNDSYYDYNLNFAGVKIDYNTKNVKADPKPEFSAGVEAAQKIQEQMLPKSEQYFLFAEKICKEMIELSRKKNADYTGGTSDPFANFTQNDNCGGATTEQGFLVRMNDKMARISNFVKTGNLQVKDEAVEDTLKDLANYCLLFLGYLESQKDDSNLG